MKIFGYLLGNENDGVLFLKEKHLLLPLNGRYSPIRLRSTMSRLLLYLLEKAHIGLVRDEHIMKYVWEIHGLKASGPRLWQVVNDLKNKLSRIGIEHSFIMRVEGRGYLINAMYFESIYIRAAWVVLDNFMTESQNITSFKLVKE
ncbi:TPA: winged helix-turn-helix domain-containing protein [Klebsiella oxytoca]|uniref:winged helix-turn-helix domain-containing protein n=1 Tax=Klebsiella oxytoca TaxID=571 RepID=UPI0018C5EA8C|nr:winged helix-turn-helix domain-containing protein [Klebsiella oxytoca]ELT8149685.1 winged helix-turn-helix domain-containing protein [Klebsiella oxytoca]ELT9463660.1 winged helix-turn-helix domain-containing protein [Klebsiella oxytoca]EME8413589.1 winged helix-turn-helix domain-containing protein [Klebsiella oxytoca]MBG2578401.1 winged helix-turn-helix domain-containing protein [Klebsiella oxytoca]MCW9500143.1 winged helix-turn-helix domain-containing protein [Klebsiella oxytoca]